MAFDQNSLALIATVLNDAETLLSGKPVSVPIPSETVKIGVVSITTPAINIEVTYTK